ncbi:MAG: biotin/lipoyl-containing protein [Hyphomicrobiales bacterium]
MADAIIMPQLGETVAEGKILSWFKAVGDDVKLGDKLFEVETDKVTVEVEAIAAGKLTEIKIGAGVTAKVGATVAVLGGAAAAATPAPAQAAAKPAAPALTAFAEVRTPLANHGKARAADGLSVSPLARRLMAESNVSVDLVASYAAGKGLRRVGEKDVRAAMAERGTAPSQPAVTPPQMPPPSFVAAGDVITLNAIRSRTADRLAENWRTIPHVFQAIEVDFTAVEEVRSRHKERFKAETGLSLTYLPFIARAPSALPCRPSRRSMRVLPATR